MAEAQFLLGPLPQRFADLKRNIASSIGPDFEQRATAAWVDLLAELKKSTAEMEEAGSKIIPQVSFSELDSLPAEQLATIKQRGCVVVKDVVADEQAMQWKSELQRLSESNPSLPGWPADDKQFFDVYWSKPQVEARAHPNVLKTSAWLNAFYSSSQNAPSDGASFTTPLSYADRYRIRKANGKPWIAHPPHVDGGSIELWEDENLRSCFASIFNGQWREHDAYDLAGRINARSSIYGAFRTYQGWLAMSDISPGQGTICFFPDVLLSTAYMMLRPFFRPKSHPVENDPLASENWEYDVSSPDFPGIYATRNNIGKGYSTPRPDTNSHPHLRLDKTMIPVPTVSPGDMVFWHGNLIHAVEVEHTGVNDSAVMYIGTLPTTKNNLEFIARQRGTFERGETPPDYLQGPSEASYVGVGRPEHIIGDEGLRAMGFSVSAAA